MCGTTSASRRVIGPGHCPRPRLRSPCSWPSSKRICRPTQMPSTGRPPASRRSMIRSPPTARTCSMVRSEEHTSELQSRGHLVCRLLLEKKKHSSQLQSRCHCKCRLQNQKKKQKGKRREEEQTKFRHITLPYSTVTGRLP